MSGDVRAQREKRRDRWAWYFYDFGNSAYAAVVLLAVYAAYFKGQVVGGAEGSRLWGLSVGIAMLVVALISPVLGTIADFSSAKKRFLFVFTMMACCFTGLLFFVEQGDVFRGMLFFILAEIGYRAAQVFYNSLLPEITTPEEMGRVSGTGWAIGSAGGIVCLLIILPLILLAPRFFGVAKDLVVRLSFLITASFYFLSSLPTFIWLKERSKPQPLPEGQNYLAVGFRRLMATVKTAKHFREFIKFVVAFLIYNDGVIMALNFASIIGAVLFGMGETALIIFVIIVQATNVVGAYVFGQLVDRLGGKHTLIFSIGTMIMAIIMMFFAQTQLFFYFIGALAGFAMAGIQSVSRTMVSMLCPAGQSAEFYGFFAVAGRTSSFIGPTIYGWIAAEVAFWYQDMGIAPHLAEQAGQRFAILSIGAFLLVGLLILSFVDEKQGRKANQPTMDNKNLIQV